MWKFSNTANKKPTTTSQNLRLLRLHMKKNALDKWNIWNGSNAQVNAHMKFTCHEEEDMENEEGKMKAQEPVEEEVLSTCVCEIERSYFGYAFLHLLVVD